MYPCQSKNLNYLFNILPVGVVSKKLIGHLRMLFSSEECSLLDAIHAAIARMNDATNAIIPGT